MSEPGHEFLKGQGCCLCGWKPEFRGPVHPEVQWGNHLAQVRADGKQREAEARRADLSRETALRTLRKIASSTGDQTVPTEDVIDLAQAVLALLGEAQ